MGRKFRSKWINNKAHLIAIILIVTSAASSISAEFSIGIYSGNTPYNLSNPTNVINPVLTAKDVTDISAKFVADPFMVFENNTWYMFFEIYVSETNLGHIGVATSNDGLEWVYNQIVLKENFHTAYPYVFKMQNEYYMIPDTYSIDSIRLYKATNFPYQWEFVTSLLDGPGYLDASVVNYNSKWWLFTSVPSDDTLYLFYADNLLGPWTSHSMNPIISGNPDIARPGGRIVNYNGTLLRHAQDDDPTYGNAVHVFEITNLTTGSYSERELPGSPFLKASGIGWNSEGMHNVDPVQIANDNWIACVDGYGDPFYTPASGGFLEDGTGLVSMEAEHYQANVPVGNYAWMPVTNSGYSGSGALQILPNDGANPAIAGAGPRLDYQVQFTKTGTHYIWIRALSNSLASDSLYVGLDGATAGASDMSGLIVDGVTWTWTNLKRSGDVATVNVTSPGVHTVNVWMRESGIVLDKLVLSTSAGYVPTGKGPAESASTAAAPAVTTNAATSVTSAGATLNGGVNPNGAAATAWFEWGTSPTLTTFSSTASQSLGSGTTSQAVTAALSGLTSGTTYYYRVAASSTAGTSKGSIASFSTTAVAAAPAVTTNAATSVTSAGATLNGGVNPNGVATTAWFEWGTSPTLTTFSSTASQSLGSGTTSQAVTAALSGLSSGTTYYFRVAASSTAGTSKGSIASFSTTAPASGGFLEDGTGLVSMEAEHYQANVPVGNYAWMPVTNSGYSGSGALQILPNDGANPAIAGAGPRLDYQVQFTKTGTHYIWIRALSNSLASDSLYVGLDGATAGASDMSGLIVDGVTWTWTNLKRSGDVATVNVTSPGVHTVNVWMRESGIVLDKLVLSTSAGYVPTGKGPAESASTAAAPAVTTNAATSVTSAGATLNGGVNPNGAAATAWFEWGTSSTLSTFSSTSTQASGSGTTSQAVTAALSGLTSGTTYYYRVAASSTAGTSKGSIASFSTTAAAAAPTVTTNAATSVTSAGATLNGRLPVSAPRRRPLPRR